MPITNNPVNFHFINNTPPSTYNDDTIYFDSINGNIKVGNINIAEKNQPTLIITIPIPANTFFSSNGTVMANNTVINNYNNSASSSEFWNKLRDAASNGENITIISTEEDEVMYKFNNYYYQIGSGDYLNFSLIINNDNFTEICSVEFNISGQTITQYAKNLIV